MPGEKEDRRAEDSAAPPRAWNRPINRAGTTINWQFGHQQACRKFGYKRTLRAVRDLGKCDPRPFYERLGNNVPRCIRCLLGDDYTNSFITAEYSFERVFLGRTQSIVL
jgi:hypothetical protein